MPTSQLIPTQPKVFFDTAVADTLVADALTRTLDGVADVTTTCHSVADASRTFDVAAFVLGAHPSPEMLLRLGVFLGALGRERVVLICPESSAGSLPSELRDITLATYPPAEDGSHEHAIAAACARLKDHVARLTTPAAKAHPLPKTDAEPQVARRIRRSLGFASSVRSGQTLRIADISATGALLETYGEIPEHQILDLNLNLGNGRHVGVTAKVVRIQYPQWGRVGGVGVQWVKFQDDARENLERYLEETTN